MNGTLARSGFETATGGSKRPAANQSVRACPGALAVSPMSTGPGSTCNLPVSLVNFQGSSCVGTASSHQAPHLHGGRCSLIARLQPARYPRCRLAPPPLSLLGLPAQWPVVFHTCPRISSQAGFPSRTERWKPRIGGTVSLRFRQTREVRKARYYLHGIPHTQRSSPTHEVSILLEGWGGIHGELLEAPSGNHDPCGRHRQR